MFYKLANKLFVVGRFYFGSFGFYFGIFLIFPQLRCSHCALRRDKQQPQNNLQHRLDLIYITYLKNRSRLNSIPRLCMRCFRGHIHLGVRRIAHYRLMSQMDICQKWAPRSPKLIIAVIQYNYKHSPKRVGLPEPNRSFVWTLMIDSCVSM